MNGWLIRSTIIKRLLKDTFLHSHERTNERANERKKESTIIKLNIELLVINIFCRTQVNKDG